MAQDYSAYRAHSLPRLDPSCYQSDATVIWTLKTRDRATGWLSDRLHQQFRELLLHAAGRDSLLCPTYVLMPDHIHLIWIGLEPDSDQRNAMAFLRTHLSRLIAPARLQPQPHDHVLTSEERTKKLSRGSASTSPKSSPRQTNQNSRTMVLLRLHPARLRGRDSFRRKLLALVLENLSKQTRPGLQPTYCPSSHLRHIKTIVGIDGRRF